MNKEGENNGCGYFSVSYMWKDDADSEGNISLPSVRLVYYLGFKFPEYYARGTTVGGEKPGEKQK